MPSFDSPRISQEIEMEIFTHVHCSQLVKRASIGLALLAMTFCTSVRGDVIAQFDSEAATNADRVIPSTVGSGVTVTNLAGTNLNAPTSLTLPGANPGDSYIAFSRSAGLGGTDLLSAIADNTFFSFTITPDAGQSVSVDSVTLDAFAGTAGNSDRSFFLLSDQTGFLSSNSLLSASTVTGSPLIPFNGATAEQSFSTGDLSTNSDLQNITDSVTFRVYLRAPNTFQNLAFDDITVNGTVSSITVPEPSALALLGVGTMFATFRRRRIAA